MSNKMQEKKMEVKGGRKRIIRKREKHGDEDEKREANISAVLSSFICHLFTRHLLKATSMYETEDYVGFTDRLTVSNEFETMWKNALGAKFKILSGTCLGELRKTTKIFSQDSRCLGRESTSAPP
jgi:hypothetical protein